ncbi:MAG TPA: hypothetical protein VN605_01930, partial [Thermoanaerobaculia bacterium]|nr:hypothetical protein [Thermoanaerobaculia bacterium]
MKKIVSLFVLAAAISAPSFAIYIVVMKDGTQYKAKTKWTIQNGKAIVTLESGQTLAIDPSLIDAAKSEQTTKLGLGDARIIDLNPNLSTAAPANKPGQPSIGSTIHLRQPGQNAPGAGRNAPPTAATPTAAVV